MEGKSSNTAHRVALLAGGDSAEREISIASGQQVAIALALADYEPVLIDPAEIDLREVDWPSFDVCFIALHGGAGEDGRVQQQLKRLGVPYTGSGPSASRRAMNKSAAKRRFADCGVPTLPFIDFNAAIDPASLVSLEAKLASLPYPLVIKPESQGSSLGVAVAKRPDDLRRCVQLASQFDVALIGEPYIIGREFTVSLLGRDPLPMIEIVSPQPVFSYDAKYSNAATQYRFDCALTATVERKLYDAAVQAAEALHTDGLVRVDLILDRQNRPWLLELNSIPGMTQRSLAPQAASAAGIEMPALVDWMVRDAMHRYAIFAANRREAMAEPLALSETDCL